MLLNRCSLLTLFFAFFICIPHGNAAQTDSIDKKIRIATHSVDRMSYALRDGYWDGRDIRVARYVLNKLGYKEGGIEFVEVGLEEKFSRVTSGDCRFYIGAATLTAIREEMGDFTTPHLSVPYGVVIRVEDPGLIDLFFKAIRRTIGWLFHPIFWVILCVLVFYLCLKAIMVAIVERIETKPDIGFGDLLKGTLWWAACTFCNFNSDSGDYVPRGYYARIVATGFTILLVIVGFNYMHEAMTDVMKGIRHEVREDFELSGLHVGVKRETTSVDFAHEMGASIQDFDSIEEAMSALETGDVEAVLYDAITLQALIQNREKQRGYQLLFVAEYGSQYYGAFFQDGDPMIEDWNQVVLNIPPPLTAEWDRQFLK